MAASVAPPSTLPNTMDDRLTGAASTESRKPSLRSWMSDIMLKIAVKSTIMTTAPGKRKKRKKTKKKQKNTPPPRKKKYPIIGRAPPPPRKRWAQTPDRGKNR